jgi:dolichol-phosphate mannosyltransferase
MYCNHQAGLSKTHHILRQGEKVNHGSQESEIMVFLPTYNERENLALLTERLFGLGLDLSILVVDDSSPDGTGEVADQLARQHEGRFEVIHRQGTRGRGTAGILGLSRAAGVACKYVIEMDADLSHDPDEIPKLLQAAEQADLVIGSRYMEGGEAENFGLLRQLNSKVARLLTRMLLGLNYTDPTSGFRVYRRELLQQLPWERMISPGPSVVEETLYYIRQTGARIVEVPIHYRERHTGNSKITPGIIAHWILTLLKIRLVAAGGKRDF